MSSSDEEFSVFVAARADPLCRQAWLLTGHRPAAEDLVQTALTKAYAAWSRVRRADDPVAYVHGVLMKAFLSDRGRRWASEAPVSRDLAAAGARAAHRPSRARRADGRAGRAAGSGRRAGRPQPDRPGG